MARRRSFGSAFLGFIRGLVSFVLVIVLIGSVGANLIFRESDSALKIDFLNYHVTLFVNNSSDLKYIDEGSLCFIDHTKEIEENRYVLCSVGNRRKTILCLESIGTNENGTPAYNVRADRMSSLDTVYTIPASKIYGTVYNKDDLIGDMIVFARQPYGIASLMLLPALLLVILSIAAIRSKRARYDDDLLDAEMQLEELRKSRRNDEKKAEEHRKLMAQKAAEEAEAAIAAKVVEAKVEAAEREASAPHQTPLAVADSEPEQFSFEEYKRKSAPQPAEQPAPAPAPAAPVSEPAPAPAPVPAPSPVPSPAPAPVQTQAPASENVNKYEYTDFVEEDKKAEKEKTAESKPVFQEVPLTVRPSYRYETLIQNAAEAAEIKQNAEPKPEAPAEKVKEPVPAPVPAPAPAAAPAQPAVKKKAKPPVKKLDAESIDDLIRILEEEKKKLD